MNTMKLLSVVTPPCIYHVCSTQKMFWEKKSSQVNMGHCGCCNVMKQRDTKNSEQYIALDISLKCGNMDNMKSHIQNQNII